MRESRWPPPFTRALKRNLQGSFFCCWVMGDGCWMLGVDEVLRGGEWDYYIGLIERIGLIRLLGIRANAIRTDSVFKADSA